MTSIFSLHVAKIAKEAAASFLKSDEFKAKIRKAIMWELWGFEASFNASHRAAFTQTVADRIRKQARRPIYFLGFRVWRARYPSEWCAHEAERIVTEFLETNNIKFGDPHFYWGDGHHLADEEMENWEACP